MWRIFIIVSMASSVSASAQESGWLRELRRAKSLESQGDYRAARQVLLGRVGATKNVDDKAAAAVFNNLATSTHQLGDYRAAEKYYRESMRRLKLAGDAGTEFQDRVLSNLAVLYGARGQYAKGRKLLLQVLEDRFERYGPRDASVALALHNIGAILIVEGNYASAEGYLRRALSILTNVETPSGELGMVYGTLARSFYERGDYDQAEKFANDALTILQSNSKKPAALIDALILAARTAARRGAYPEAAGQLTQAMSVARRSFGEQSPNSAYVLLAQSELEHRQKRNAEAKRLAAQANGLLAAHAQKNSLGQTVDYGLLRVSPR